jgi:hypothetical protein
MATDCISPIAAPSAVSEEVYLCDAEHQAEFDARLEQCRQANQRDGSCGGLLSFRGIADGQDVVVGVPATRVARQQQPPDPRVGFVLFGTGPYFTFRLAVIDETKAAPGTASGTAASNSDFIDFTARGGNYLANFINETREPRVLTADEVGFMFSTDLALGGGHLDGCLDVFVPTQ